jgi:hypothetical protein
MATANCLWGAPRIHGELLKLAITVSERTVSRYMPDRMTAPSQTWRTFLTNHLGDLAFISGVMSSYAKGDDDVVDGCVCPSVPLRLHAIGSRASGPWTLVDSPPSIQLLSLGRRVAQNHRHHRTRASSGKDPHKPWAVELDRTSPKEPISGLRPFDRRPLDRHRQVWAPLSAQSGRQHRWRFELPSLRR